MSEMDVQVQVIPGGELVVGDPSTWDEEERGYQAHRLKLTGLSWARIARTVGYANAKTAEVAHRAWLQRAMEARSVERRQEALELQDQRYDALINAYWHTAVAGNEKHADVVLKAMAGQNRLNGLEELHARESESSKTIIVSGENFAATLKAYVQAKSTPPALDAGDTPQGESQ